MPSNSSGTAWSARRVYFLQCVVVDESEFKQVDAAKHARNLLACKSGQTSATRIC